MAQSASSPVTVSPRPRSLPSRSSTRTAAQSPRRGSAGACAGVPGPGGSSSVSYTFNLSGSAKIVAGISAYVGVDSSTANGIDASGGNSGSSTSVTAPSVTTSRAGDMVAAYWATNTNTTLPADASTTQRWTLLSGGGGAKHTGTAGDYTFAGTGGTGTKVSTAGASGAWVADQVALFLDNTPPSAPPPTITEGSNDSYQSGSTFYYRPAGGGGTFTVTEGASDPESGVKQVAFPGLAGGFTPTTVANVTASPYSRVYTWPGANGGSDSGSKTITVTDNASGTATNSFTITPDSSVPTPVTTFPGTGWYNATGWAAGCASAGFCGTTVVDGVSGLQLVEISIRRDSTGLYWNSGAFGSAAQVFQPATGTTTWSYGFGAASFPADGTYTITVRATDNVSNVATASSSTFTWDTTPPAAPSSLAVSPVSPANNNAPKVSGTAEANSTVNLYTNATCTSALAATGTAAAFSSPGLALGVADVCTATCYATANDAANNVSPCSSGVAYVEDSTAPVAPSSLAVSPSSPANNNAPKVSGSAEAGSTVKLYSNATCTSALAATGTAAAFSSPGLAVAVVDDSSTTFYATATDAAGNVSPCSSGVTYVEDSTAPVAPSSLAVPQSSPAHNNAPKVSGSAEAGSTVKLYTNATCTRDRKSVV